ncbi:hypothetical protein MAR_005788, partial [Mya arenaria]
MVLMKLRQNFDFQHLGQLFSISQHVASAIFNNWIQYLFFRSGSVPIWPHRDIITISHIPPKYLHKFPTTQVIIRFYYLWIHVKQRNQQPKWLSTANEDVHELWENSQREGVMVDKRFKINKELEELGLKLNIPLLPTVDSQMSASVINMTETIARHRDHVERAIAGVKNFKILTNRINLSLYSKSNM